VLTRFENSTHQIKNSPSMKTTIRSIVTARAWACLATLMLIGGAQAGETILSPTEGTLGTAFTISGSGFGSKKGVVRLGRKVCDIDSWSDKKIQCTLRFPMAAGVYDVVVDPLGNRAETRLPGAFAVRPPFVAPPLIRPRFLTEREIVTITGGFFGTKGALLKVQLEDRQGNTKTCRVIRQAMNWFAIQLPKGMSGRCTLRVSNVVGSDAVPDWGTFVPAPENAPHLVGTVFSGSESKDNASAVSYHNKLWIFWTQDDDDGNIIQYKTWDGTTMSSGTNLVASGNTDTLTTKSPITPVVVDDLLYLFWTGPSSSNLCYAIYNPSGVKSGTAWQGVWNGVYTVPSSHNALVTGGFAAVHNFTKDRIEVYWTPNKKDVNMKTLSLSTGTWGNTTTVSVTKTNSTINPYITAVFNQLGTNDWVTYLSYDDGSAGYMAETKDGVVLKTCSANYWHEAAGADRGPYLVDLGDDYLAVLYNREGEYSCYQKYDKKARAVVNYGKSNETKVPFTSSHSTGWEATGVAFSTKISDSTSPTGYRVDTTFYAFVGNNPPADQTNWELVKCEYLGYWMPTNAGTVLDCNSAANIEDTFALWPVLGVVDMPPFILNGNPLCTNSAICNPSFVEVTVAGGTNYGVGGEYSAGAYVETTEKSRVALDASTGYSGGFDKTTNFSYSQTASLANTLEGKIFAYYLVPKLKFYGLEWHDLNGAATGIYSHSVEIIGSTVRAEAMEPESGPIISEGTVPLPYLDPAVFPLHGYESDIERLNSYSIAPTAPPYNYVDAFGANSPAGQSMESGFDGGFEWSIETANSVDNGFYVEMKLGTELCKRIGLGVEGSFEMRVTTSTDKSMTVTTAIPYPDSGAPTIHYFHVEGYWLAPNASGYWVPENRKGLGDTPWFITYYVPEYEVAK
jgi:hypothetical protein